jgi:hypothetical protein
MFINSKMHLTFITELCRSGSIAVNLVMYKFLRRIAVFKYSMNSHCYAVGKSTMTISEQGLGKHIPMDLNMHVTIDLLWKRGVFYVAHAEML